MSVHQLNSYVTGEPVKSSELLEVFDPYTGELAGTVTKVDRNNLDRAIEQALKGPAELTRYQRHEILLNAKLQLKERTEEFSDLITLESGLCKRESLYEVGRACDVLQFAAMEALRDDGEIFSCDISPQGKARKIFTLREPLPLMVAITPFNHPLNQVAHKLAPAIAAGTPTILKPSEKTPLTAIRFAELLYEEGLPASMLSVLLGGIEDIVEPMVRDSRVSLVSFTGGVRAGKRIAEIAGYKKTCLELGGNAPLIVLEDAEMELAVKLAAEGCYRNSGQRCTAVKRLLIHEEIHDEFLKQFVEKSKEYLCGDPKDPETRVGTVIDEDAAIYLEAVVNEAVKAGAEIVLGGKRNGAQIEPTVIKNVPRNCKMVVEESFGPLAPIIKIKDLDDAIELANSTAYGLSSGIVTQNMNSAIQAVKGIKTGTVNVNEVPGYRIESSPFGGIKDSGLGIKEGVIEAIKTMTTVKTFSLPW